MAYLTIDKLNNIIFDNLDENGDEYKIFIESGTFLGQTTIKLQPYFNTLYTVELSEKYFNIFIQNYFRYFIIWVLISVIKICDFIYYTYCFT